MKSMPAITVITKLILAKLFAIEIKNLFFVGKK